MKYIIAACIAQKDADGNLPNGLSCHRAVYFAEDGHPHGLPIMFLRDLGMEDAAQELINSANLWEK